MECTFYPSMITDQAVILCGGRGSRLRPLTDTLPKPLAPVAGKPFLFHLLSQLKRNGFREVLLLTGYLGHLIAEAFGDGSDLGLRLVYQQGPEEWETAFRLQQARPLLREHFLLLYADNYANFQLRRVEEVFKSFGRLACLSVQPRDQRVNIACTPEGDITVYDSSRMERGLNSVEIGYALFSVEIFSHFTGENESFSKVLGRLGAARQLCAFIQRDLYYSISDPGRLQIADAYLTPKKILLIDRDGTINRKMPRAEYVRDWNQFEFIPETLEGLERLAAAGWSFLVVSNQAGVARGMLTEGDVWELDRRMVAGLRERGIQVHQSYYCFHHWDEKCACRKPEPGMLHKASKEHKLALEQTWYIGDDLRDCTAAWRAGCKSALIGCTEDPQQLPPEEHPQICCDSVSDFASIFLSQ
jgi:histidinol-phosphate phosphatase family protein